VAHIQDALFGVISLLEWLHDYVEYTEVGKGSLKYRRSLPVEPDSLHDRLNVVFQEHRCGDESTSMCAACSRLMRDGWYATAEYAVMSPEITAYRSDGLIQVVSARKDQAGSPILNELLNTAECTVTGYRGNGTPVFKAHGLFREAGRMIIPYKRNSHMATLINGFLEAHATQLSVTHATNEARVVFRHELVSNGNTLDTITKAKGTCNYFSLAPISETAALGVHMLVPGEPRNDFMPRSPAGLLGANLDQISIESQEDNTALMEPSIFTEARWSQLATYSELLAYREHVATHNDS
jgi:hypothetical protein